MRAMAISSVTALASVSVILGPLEALWVCVGLLAVPLGLQVWEVTCRRRPPEPDCRKSPLSTTVVVSAYLPNEEFGVISTLRQTLQTITYAGEWSVVLAYNTPTRMGLESELAELARSDGRLTVRRIAGSSSKAANLNAVIPTIGSDVIGIIDADVLVAPNALTRASAWLAAGFDFVQGAVEVREATGLLAKLVAVDVESKHLAAYSGRYGRAGVAYFAGSNGFWRRDVVARLGFRNEAYVEDIDCAVRGLLSGCRVVYDGKLRSSELPPATWRGLWRQRLRWAFGWAQLTGWFAAGLARSPHLSPLQRRYWLATTVVRRILAPSSLVVGTASAFAVQLWSVVPPLAALSALAIGTSALQVCSAARHDEFVARPVHQIVYTFGAPCFEFLRTFAAVVALFRQPRWSVTPRPHPRWS